MWELVQLNRVVALEQCGKGERTILFKIATNEDFSK